MDCNCVSPIGLVHYLNVAFPCLSRKVLRFGACELWLNEYTWQCQSYDNYLWGTWINFLIREIYFRVRNLMNLTTKLVFWFNLSILSSSSSSLPVSLFVVERVLCYFIQDKDVERNPLFPNLPTSPIEENFWYICLTEYVLPLIWQ